METSNQIYTVGWVIHSKIAQLGNKKLSFKEFYGNKSQTGCIIRLVEEWETNLIQYHIIASMFKKVINHFFIAMIIDGVSNSFIFERVRPIFALHQMDLQNSLDEWSFNSNKNIFTGLYRSSKRYCSSMLYVFHFQFLEFFVNWP